MKNNLYGKHVVITGGGSGIGAALAKEFLAREARVIIIGRSKKPPLFGDYYQADMSEFDQAEAVFKKVLQKYDYIDYMINNAGIFMGGEIQDTPIKDWQRVIDNNIYAVANGTHLAYHHMIGIGKGGIVNVASTAGLIPVPAMGIYGSTKYAIVGLTRALRNEATALGIKVSVVCPTIVNTPLYDTATYNGLDKHKILRHRTTLQTPEWAARKIIKGILKGRAVIHTSYVTRAIWAVERVSPALYDFFARRVIQRYRSTIRSDKSAR